MTSEKVTLIQIRVDQELKTALVRKIYPVKVKTILEQWISNYVKTGNPSKQA